MLLVPAEKLLEREKLIAQIFNELALFLVTHITWQAAAAAATRDVTALQWLVVGIFEGGRVRAVGKFKAGELKELANRSVVGLSNEASRMRFMGF